MSKTDKTAPYWVKQMYDHAYIEPIHDHRFHDCNLPERPSKTRDLRDMQWSGSDDRNCFWWPSWAFWRSRWGRCGCYMCSHDAFQTPRRKRDREYAKRYCADGWRDEY